MNKETGLLNGKFSFKALPHGSLNKNKFICIYCQCELSYHWSTLSLKYHLLAKHTADAERPSSPSRKEDHAGKFATEKPGQLDMRQAFSSDSSMCGYSLQDEKHR